MAKWRYEQVEGPTERVTKFWGRLYVTDEHGECFESRIGTKMAKRIVELLNRYGERDDEI